MNSYPDLIHHVLMIGYVWPETNASAAGLRDWALLEQFRAAGWKVYYASPAKPNAFSKKLEEMGVPTFSCEANDPRFDQFVRELNPEVVIFDRFVIEEQFGWRVEEQCPGALRVLDTQDLHCLRRAREAALKKEFRETLDVDSPVEAAAELIEKFAPEDLLRELSSIYRSDLTLVISSFELQLLTEVFGIPGELLLLQRLSYRSSNALKSYAERSDFVSIGNFRHPPNADAVHWLSRTIWPEIRRRMPEAQIHIYGAYPSKEMMELTDAKNGFWVKGPAEDQYETLSRYRVLLAPLRFGAGIKGKISDAWSVGTPVVTTPIGAEGMCDTRNWPGSIASTATEFAAASCRLIEDEERWAVAQNAGLQTICDSYDHEANARTLTARIPEAFAAIIPKRQANLTGRLLRMNMHRSTKYFSRWIELKQSVRSGTPVA